MTNIVITMAAAFLGFSYYENNCFKVTKFQIDLNIKKKLRILQISDLHSKEFGENNKRLIKKIKEQKPDIIVATGDIIDSSLKNMEEIIEFLAVVDKIAKVVYIPGNNEIRCSRYKEIISKLKAKNIMVLINEIVSLEVNNNKLNILGLVEGLQKYENPLLAKAKDSYYYKDADKLFYKLEKMEGLKIVLSHYPENFKLRGDKSYEKYDFDLMFSGHAHGGQFILPFVGGLFSPGQGVLPKYYAGIYGDKNKLIVSRGLGNSGFPLRLFNRPDIVVVDIV